MGGSRRTNINANDDNPWAEAASSPPTRASLTRPLTDLEEATSEPPVPMSSEQILEGGYFCCSRLAVKRTLKIWMVLDIGVAVALLVRLYLGLPQTVFPLEIPVILLASLLLFRSILSSCGMATDLVCERSTLLWSSYLSWVLFISVPVVIAFFEWEEGVWAARWLLITIGCGMLLEVYRYFLLRHYYRYQMQHDRLELQRPARGESPSRPWWWSSQSDLEEPFLANRGTGLDWVHEESTPSSNNNNANNTTYYSARETDGNWWDSVFFWRGSTDEADPRDDCSVAFASVQEEWASRAEEDPFWWSREANEGSNNKRSDGSSFDPPSWIRTSPGSPADSKQKGLSQVDDF